MPRHLLKRIYPRLGLMREKRFREVVAICAITIVAAIGVDLLSPSHAASPYIASQAEQGSFDSGATVQGDVNAAGGQYIQFGSAPGVQAVAATSFLDSLGANVHMSYYSTPYGNATMVAQRLQQLGIHYVRDNIGTTDATTEMSNLKTLQAAGIKFDFIVNQAPPIGADQISNILSELKSNGLVSSTVSMEGSNELDSAANKSQLPCTASTLTVNNCWAVADADYQQELYKAVKADPAFKNVQVIAPSIIESQTPGDDNLIKTLVGNGTIPSISSNSDAGNTHDYPRGGTPEIDMPTAIGNEHIVSGATNLITATETGYHNSVNCVTNCSQPGVPESVQATYMPRIYLENFSLGLPRTYEYEFVDQGTDDTDAEQVFGILHNDFSLKPAAQAIENLTTILSDSGSNTPGTLDYSLSGLNGNIHHELFEKHDGTFYLALWDDLPVWNTVTQQPIVVSPNIVTLTFNQAVSSTTQYDPTNSAVAGASIDNPRSLSLQVGPNVTLIKIVPAT